MGDQIISHLALSGGQARVSKVTEHARSNVDVMRRFNIDIKSRVTL